MTRLGVPAPNGWKGLRFGSTVSPYSPSHPHRGQDWGWFYSNPRRSKKIVSPAPGKVTKVVDGYTQGDNQNQGWGNYVEITLAPGVIWRACHFDKGTISVKRGQDVEPDDYLGPMGQSGKTNGPHLHEELWIKGVRVNPETYREPAGKHLPGTPTTSGGGSKPLPPKEEEVPVIHKKVFAKKNQRITSVKNYLYLDDKNSVQIAVGPLDVTNAVLSLRGTASSDAFGLSDKAFPPVIQIDPVVETVVNGKVEKSDSLGIHEVILTADSTFGQVALPAVSLKANQHLRIKAQVYGFASFSVSQDGAGTSLTYVTFK